MDRKVNTLVIGAQKSGTTSLFEYLRQHPDVQYSTVKELTYFIDAEVFARGEEEFHSWFSRSEVKKIKASGHVHMLSCDSAPLRVREYNPDMKFIVVLRDPLERAWSAFNFAKSNGWEGEDMSFDVALKLEDERYDSRSHRARYDLAYARNGLYGQHLRRWAESFDKSQIFVIRSVDLRDNCAETLSGVFDFLEISPAAQIDSSVQHNVARRFRWKPLARLIHDRNSRLKKAARFILPTRLRAWLRGNILPAVIQANQVTVTNDEIPAAARNMLHGHFDEDQKILLQEFGVRL